MPSPLPVLPAHPAATGCCAPPAGIDPALDAERIAAIAKALAEPLRVHIVDVLRRSENDICQCALITELDVHQPLLAYHMKKLIGAGLVRVERRHKWAYYSVSTDGIRELIAWLKLTTDPRQPRPEPQALRSSPHREAHVRSRNEIQTTEVSVLSRCGGMTENPDHAASPPGIDAWPRPTHASAPTDSIDDRRFCVLPRLRPVA